MSKTHELRTWPGPFQMALDGTKAVAVARLAGIATTAEQVAQILPDVLERVRG
jgi:hypothetical protein